MKVKSEVLRPMELMARAGRMILNASSVPWDNKLKYDKVLVTKLKAKKLAANSRY